MKFILFPLLLIILASCTSPTPKEITLYQNEDFTLTNYKVTQDKYTAHVVSDSEIRSNYFNEPRDLSFKFAINGLDNEMGFGVDHHVKLYPDSNGKMTLPLIQFGEVFNQTQDETDKTPFLEPNTAVTFQVDLNSVFEDITKNKIYKGANGHQIKGISSISILGSKTPLDWDFDGKNNVLVDEDGDGIYSTTLIFNPIKVENGERKWVLSNDIKAYPQFSSDLPLINALYNLSLDELEKLRTKDGFWDTGAKWSGVWTRDMSYSILLSLAYLDPETAKACLRAKVKNNRIIQDTGTGGSWPISSDRMTWSLAAWEIYSVTGDLAWLDEAFTIISNSAEDDLKTVLSVDSLIYGETSFADWREQSYPRWMQPKDIYTSEAADNGMIHFKTYEILRDMATLLESDSLSTRYGAIASDLKQRLNDTFWLEDKGYFAQYTYGTIAPVLSERSMALAESFGILFDVASKENQVKIASKTPLVPFGIPIIYPQIPNIPAYHNNGIWPFAQAFWNWSASKVKNERALNHGLASIYRASALFLTNKENLRADNGNDYPTEINSDRQLWSVAGNLAMVYRVFLGMSFEPNGIRFEPTIPKSYSGDKTIKGFMYRGQVVDITIHGFGKTISKFVVNNIEQSDAFISSNLKGPVKIEITLDNQSFDSDPIHLVPNVFALETPVLVANAKGFEWKPIPGAISYEILKNGIPVDTVQTTTFAARQEYVVTEYQVKSLEIDGFDSFYSNPLDLTRENAQVWIEAERFANYSRKGSNGYKGYGFVKMSTDENEKNIRFPIYITLKGAYWVDFRYSNGNGPINTENKTGIRSLYQDSELKASMIFPQRGSNDWSNWGFSNRVKLDLKVGRNVIELRYDGFNANMNGEINAFWLDGIRLVKAAD